MPETGAVHYFDLSAYYDVVDNFTLFAGVDNVLDEDPPFYLYERETYDAIGRRFTIGFTANF